MWNLVALGMMAVGLPLFALPSLVRVGQSAAVLQVDLPHVALVVLLTASLLVVHEAIHGGAMLLFGARPSFGAVLAGQVMPALYATSRGHVFTRVEYLIVALTPAVIISVIGFWACLSPWAAYLIFPLAFHLGGCVGDAAATWQVLRQPHGTLFEDLRDGLRFHRPA